MGRALGPDHHDLILLEYINSQVQKSDFLYIVGDFAWRGAGDIRRQIRCRNVFLILGNHDRLTKSEASMFSQVVEAKEIKLGPSGKHQEPCRCYLSHYPAAYWPASHYGACHCYGHLHDQREETLDSLFPGRRSMDVGIDTALRVLGEPRPFREDEILDILLARPGHDPVSWYRERKASFVAEPVNPEKGGSFEVPAYQKS